MARCQPWTLVFITSTFNVLFFRPDIIAISVHSVRMKNSLNIQQIFILFVWLIFLEEGKTYLNSTLDEESPKKGGGMLFPASIVTTGSVYSYVSIVLS